MCVIYLAHPRYHGMTFIPFLEKRGIYIPNDLPHEALHGPSSCVWIIPGTYSGE